MNRQIIIGLLVLVSVSYFASAERLSYKEGDLLVCFTGTDGNDDGSYIPMTNDPLANMLKGNVPLPMRPRLIGPVSKRARKNAISQSVMPGSNVHKDFDNITDGLSLVRLPKGKKVKDALYDFFGSSDIAYVEPNYKRKLLWTDPCMPNDPDFYQQWALHNIGQTGGSWDCDIDAPEAWGIKYIDPYGELVNATGIVPPPRDTSVDPNTLFDPMDPRKEYIIVAVLDTGMDYTHPDLADNVWTNVGERFYEDPNDANTLIVDPNEVDDDENGFVDDLYGYDFAGAAWNEDDPDGDPMDTNFHGTLVAGIIGAKGNNEIGISGVLWDVKLMPLKIFADDASSAESPQDAETTIDHEIEAISYAIANKANVINASFGGPTYSMSERGAIANAGSNGIMFVAAAGNDGADNDWDTSYSTPQTPSVFPASYTLDNIISVMATDANDMAWSGSNYGAESVDLAAPGVDILSTTPVEETEAMGELEIRSNYDTFTGTSVAAPHVSGAVALMLTINPELTISQIKTMILRGVDRQWSLQDPDKCVSKGRLNLYNCINMARGTEGCVLQPRTGQLYDSITEAINAFVDGVDTELVAQEDRWYFELLNYGSKQIKLRSGDFQDEDGRSKNNIGPPMRDTTYISAVFDNPSFGSSPSENVVTINGGQSDAGLTNIEGFSVTDGDIGIIIQNSTASVKSCNVFYNEVGGGIYFNNSDSSDVTNCRIFENYNKLSNRSAGITSINSSHNISNTSIHDNFTEGYGGAMSFSNSSASISGGSSYFNRSVGHGGAIHADTGSDLQIYNQYFSDNNSLGAGGSIYLIDSSSVLDYCEIYDSNSISDGGAVFMRNSVTEIHDSWFWFNRASGEGNGGAVYADGGSDLIVSGSDMYYNMASGSGGSMYVENGSNLAISDTYMTDSLAAGMDLIGDEIPAYGGALSVKSTPVSITDCDVSNNTIMGYGYGGGIYLENCPSSSIVGTSITKNRAYWDGGGLYCRNSDIDLSDSLITSNSAQDFGGGINCFNSDINIFNCLFSKNFVDSWDGGALYLNNSSPTLTNCTFADNSASIANTDGLGGAILCYDSSNPTINNTIFHRNQDFAIGAWDSAYIGASDPAINNCLFGTNGGGDYCVFDEDTWTATIYTGADAINALAFKNDNIKGDPLFVQGALGDYYLSHYDAGQILDSKGDVADPTSKADSPAIDMGLGTAGSLGLDDPYSTRTDKVPDDGTVDIGYHYNDPTPLRYFILTTSVVGDGTISPATSSFKEYSQVHLIAEPGSEYQFLKWSGTDDDTKFEKNQVSGEPLRQQQNIVTMNSDRNVIAQFQTILVILRTRVLISSGDGTIRGRVYPKGESLRKRGEVVKLTAVRDYPSDAVIWGGTDDDYSVLAENTVTMTKDIHVVEVEFYAPQVLTIPGMYPTIQAAIDAANNRDIITLEQTGSGPGESYKVSSGFTIIGKDITLTSVHPDDPDCVANTVIEPQSGSRAFYFSNVGRGAVINGITFRGFRAWGGDGINVDGFLDGTAGGSAYGGAIVCSSGASPTIKNCVFQNCIASGGNGANGQADGDIGGHGGWPGKGAGGAIAVRASLSQMVITGQDADGNDIYHFIPTSSQTLASNPLIINCVFEDCHAFGGNGGDGADALLPGRGGGWYYQSALWGKPYDWFDRYVNYYMFGYLYWSYGDFYDYRTYTGLGGAIYVGDYCTPEIIDCSFVGNSTEGGLCGISGSGMEPRLHYQIDNYGGAIYCDSNSTPLIRNCEFIDNVASTGRPGSDPNSGDGYDNDDIYVSHGGAIATRFNGQPTIEGCTFTNSTSTDGGAIYSENSKPMISDSVFNENSAYLGGAIRFEGGYNTLARSDFNGNSTTWTGGPGGAICSTGADLAVTDVNIVDCFAMGSGGGIYLSGVNGTHGADNSIISNPRSSNVIKIGNTLIRDCTATRDGGGISVNWYCDPNIIGSTITANKVTSEEGYGGGISASYGSYAKILNSIIWCNRAADGSQLGLTTDYEYDIRPSFAKVENSLVGPKSSFFCDAEMVGDYSDASEQTSMLIDSQDIYDQLAASGKAKVIVTLFEPTALREITNWDDTASVSDLRAEIANRVTAVLGTLSGSDFTVKHRYVNFTGFSGEVTMSGLSKLMSNSSVAHVEPSRKVQPALAQALTLANAMEARQTYNGTGIAIAIVDSGVDYTHPMLGGGNFPNSKVIGGYDTAELDADPMPVGEAHGTCCAGIAAGALGNVGDYVGGVSYNSKIYALKASEDLAGYLWDEDTLAAWDWCITHRNDDPLNPLKVISNSWGVSIPFTNAEDADAYSPLHTVAVDTAANAGITMLAASGNDSFARDGIGWPAAMSRVISVGAVYDTTDQVTEYSNSADILDILAPADPMYTTDIVGLGGYDPGDYYALFNGTSSACPFAAGVVAAIQGAAKQELDEELTPEQVKSLLVASGDPVLDNRPSVFTGTPANLTKPRVNLGRAIAMLVSVPIYIEEYSEIVDGLWDPDTHTWSPDSNNLSINEDPVFISGAKGDFYLDQENSPCVDAGAGLAHDFDMYRHTTWTHNIIDQNFVDIGYHYLLKSDFIGDFDYDGDVDVDDLPLFYLHWLKLASGFPDWGHEKDLNRDGIVDNRDYAIYALHYGEFETTPPTPDAMTWEKVPVSIADDTVTMTATEAFDDYSGTNVQYFFECTAGDGHDSGWTPDRVYVDSALIEGQLCGYRVKARDKRGNETGWSVASTVIVGADSIAPMPNPMTWAILPAATSAFSIGMTATTAVDNEGGPVQYQFNNSPWQSSPYYEDTGLLPSTQYGYRVRARDAVGNMTGWSTMQYATTDPPPPPDPNLWPDILDPVYDELIYPDYSYQYNEGGLWYQELRGQVYTWDGAVDPVYVRFYCLDVPGISTPWVLAAGDVITEVDFPSTPWVDGMITYGDPIIYSIIVGDGPYGDRQYRWRLEASYQIDGGTEQERSKSITRTIFDR